MPDLITAEAVHHGAMHVTTTVGAHTIEMDYPVRDDMAGPSPIQLLLASLVGCAANTVAALLRRTQQPVSGVRVRATGEKVEQPTVRFSRIDLAIEVTGAGLSRDAVQHAVDLAAGTVCPVWQMLKPAVPIEHELTIVED